MIGEFPPVFMEVSPVKTHPWPIQENMNPIGELERSSILMASTIHGESVAMLKDDMLERLQETSQKLLQNLEEPPVV